MAKQTSTAVKKEKDNQKSTVTSGGPQSGARLKKTPALETHPSSSSGGFEITGYEKGDIEVEPTDTEEVTTELPLKDRSKKATQASGNKDDKGLLQNKAANNKSKPAVKSTARNKAVKVEKPDDGMIKKTVRKKRAKGEMDDGDEHKLDGVKLENVKEEEDEQKPEIKTSKRGRKPKDGRVITLRPYTPAEQLAIQSFRENKGMLEGFNPSQLSVIVSLIHTQVADQNVHSHQLGLEATCLGLGYSSRSAYGQSLIAEATTASNPSACDLDVKIQSFRHRLADLDRESERLLSKVRRLTKKHHGQNSGPASSMVQHVIKQESEENVSYQASQSSSPSYSENDELDDSEEENLM
ncbi:hypothetical protein I317_07262 [Kwoniella heveanensis CBS 569]|nr:hypothetical protein I317_07262 [Kwoniella heveanensis CBS 569]